MDLMSGLFNGQGTGCETVPKEWWSMAPCLNRDQSGEDKALGRPESGLSVSKGSYKERRGQTL